MNEPAAPVITDSITGSLVLAADHPAALARFYGALLNVEPLPGLSSTHWRVPWPAGGWLEVYAHHGPQLLHQSRGRGSGFIGRVHKIDLSNASQPFQTKKPALRWLL
jgi:hypothetical protein